MDEADVQLVGGPCGQHGPYTFYKAFKYTKNGIKRIVTLSEFFFVKMWRDSDLLCIGELQLLWIDKNSEQVLASLRLYFLPENTPDGRMDHGEDEVLAISEKVVIRVEDLITWITVEAEWSWGRLARCETDILEEEIDVEASKCVPPRKANGTSFTLLENALDFSDVDVERRNLDEAEMISGPHVIILSFPKYCRYRAMMKRLEGVEDFYLKYKIVNALGGFYVKHPNTRVLFCKDTFDYPELEGHELLCNHLAPKLKGRPRGKRKKRSVSPGSESNESESSVSNSYNIRSESKNGLRCHRDSNVAPRRSTRCHENNENKEFVRKLTIFMKSNHTPIGRIPSLGYKELNLHEFFTKVQKLGGYDCVTTNRLWKSIFDDMSGHQNSTSAATVIRRHYERFLLPYERHLKGEEYKPLPVSERRRLKSKRGSNSFSDESSGGDNVPSPSASTSKKSPSETKENVKSEGKPSSLRSIRVKPERQKDRKPPNETDGLPNNNNIEVSLAVLQQQQQQQQQNTEDPPSDSDSRPKLEKLIIKTDSMTVKTEYPEDSSVVKIEYATVKSEPKCEYVTETVEVKLEPTVVKSELEESSSIKVETVPVKTQTEIEVKTAKYEKDAEPVMTAATPIAQKDHQLISPTEGKENIPLIKTGDTATTKNSLEVIEVPYKPPEPTNIDTGSFRSNFIHEVKKRKLDILKEGGLEVTPVKATAMKDRPSVIQAAPVQVIPKPVKVESMPPPIVTPKRHMLPHTLNVSQIKTTPTTPSKKPSNSYTFVNGATPPKVLQSKSIYTYSEKTVYGNPKDIWPSPVKPVVPKFVPPKLGGDPVDLSVGSPQKPIVEIMRVPQVTTTSSPYNRNTVTKNLYKMNSSPVMEGRRLGPNLEITLVGGPNTHRSNPPVHKQPSYVPSYVPPKRPSTEYYTPTKVSKSEENGRYKPSYPVVSKHTTMDITIPHPYKATSMKPPETNTAQMKPIPHSPGGMKPYNSNPPMPSYPPYFSQIYEQTAKGMPTYLPMLDPAVYYSAAMQSLYSNNTLSSAPMLPMPTPEQLKFYTDLMAHGRLNFPFSLPQDNVNSNNMKKQ